MSKVIVIGGGPAGMSAAYFSAKNGNETILLEKNEKLGKKLYITGKGRCNLTNDCDIKTVIENVVSNPKFLYSAVNGFSPENTKELISSTGLELKTERGNRVFPKSDKSSDVIKAFARLLSSVNVKVITSCRVLKLEFSNTEPIKVQKLLTDKGEFLCDKVIIATGGLSYPTTGSTGDGYIFAKEVGHTVIKPVAALSAMVLKEDLSAANGFLLKNVTLSVYKNGKKVFSELGEMLIYKGGIDGPLTVSCSSLINRENLDEIVLSLDFKPALSEEKLNNRLLRDFSENKGKLSVVLRKLLPYEFIPMAIKRAGINPEIQVSAVKEEDRKNLVKTIKNFELHPKKLFPIEAAIVTAGGVKVSEIDPKTMKSKLAENLYFAGEVIDVDAFTGGFNIQIALSTGHSAGISV